MKDLDAQGLDHTSLPKIDNEVVPNPDLFLSDEAKSKRALVTTTKNCKSVYSTSTVSESPINSLTGACYLNDKPHGKPLGFSCYKNCLHTQIGTTIGRRTLFDKTYFCYNFHSECTIVSI